MIIGGKRCIPWVGLARTLGRHWAKPASRLRWSDTVTEGGTKDDIDPVESGLETAPVSEPLAAAVIGASSSVKAGIIHFSTRSGGSFAALTGRGKQRRACVVVRTYTVYEGGARGTKAYACRVSWKIFFAFPVFPVSPAPFSFSLPWMVLSFFFFFFFLFCSRDSPCLLVLTSHPLSSLKPGLTNGPAKG
ncbi:hypothetical protein BO78DRAFT_104639 [Aspergillus sclerotiicarbonarius CBS 121057]|uniref:Uncharacterized protein n=1 Tax=Aspergillus sclerotiicarbonarius (strain CBS 121057 / IBT 28362) TaxID=1448318 RepID=A0A319EBR3_ASPSB|nr:hypothetical protein BO78DRAFT_104639 [Aspergillus sclerotiicarbonarius CBS 121057]